MEIENNHIKLFKEKNCKIFLFSGSWCATCVMYLPKIMKLISKLDLNANEVEIIEVSQGKDQPAELLDNHDIIFVPTLILYSNDKEVGRIIEHPKDNWESDLVRIFLELE